MVKVKTNCIMRLLGSKDLTALKVALREYDFKAAETVYIAEVKLYLAGQTKKSSVAKQTTTFYVIE